MWTIGYTDPNGTRTEVAWFLYKREAVAALWGYPTYYTVETATDD